MTSLFYPTNSILPDRNVKSLPKQMLEVGVEPAVEDRVGDRAEHGEGVNDEEKSQLDLGFNLHPH